MRSVVVLFLALLLPVVSQAGEVYHWVTDDGVFSFTDTKKQIPARYTDSAKRVEVKPFADYERLTIASGDDVTPS